eukprot:1392123-Rhodomonas_salina.1
MAAVANADIIVGTAASATELTRLRIIENVASTDLSEVNSTQIDTASIESVSLLLPLVEGPGLWAARPGPRSAKQRCESGISGCELTWRWLAGTYDVGPARQRRLLQHWG